MHEKIRAALNQFFKQRHEDEKAKLPLKIWTFSEKFIDLLFSRFYNCGPFEGTTGHRSPMPSFLIRPCWDPQVILFCI